MKQENDWRLPALLGASAMCLQVYLLYHALVKSKPFKVVNHEYLFYYTARIALPLGFSITLLLTYYLRDRVTGYLVLMIPVLTFPVLVWTIYQIIFFLLGVDVFAGSGDFTVRNGELEFAYVVVTALYLGSCLGITATFIMALVGRLRPPV